METILVVTSEDREEERCKAGVGACKKGYNGVYEIMCETFENCEYLRI